MKITPTGVGDALKSLQSNRFFPLSDLASSLKTSGQGTGSAATSSQQASKHRGPAGRPPPTPLVTPASAGVTDGLHSDTSTFFSFAEIAAGATQQQGRERSSSFKWKNSEVSPSSTDNYGNKTKNPRIEANASNSLLSTAQENLIMLEQVSNDILDATSSDPILVAIVTRLCTGITCQNNVLTAILTTNNNT
jgi:hypothetical protein